MEHRRVVSMQHSRCDVQRATALGRLHIYTPTYYASKSASNQRHLATVELLERDASSLTGMRLEEMQVDAFVFISPLLIARRALRAPGTTANGPAGGWLAACVTARSSVRIWRWPIARWQHRAGEMGVDGG